MTDPLEELYANLQEMVNLYSFKCKCVDPVGSEAEVIQIYSVQI